MLGAAPFALAVGTAALLGLLLRPATPQERPASLPTSTEAKVPVGAPPPRTDALPATTVPGGLLVEDDIAPEEKAEPLPPLKEGTTVTDLMNQHADEVCACPDLKCVEAARRRHLRLFGQAEPSKGPTKRREIARRIEACLQTLRDASDEDDPQGG